MSECKHPLELVLGTTQLYWQCIFCEDTFQLEHQEVKLGDLDAIVNRLKADSREWALQAYAAGEKIRCTTWLKGLWVCKDEAGPCSDVGAAIQQLFQDEWRGWESYED